MALLLAESLAVPVTWTPRPCGSHATHLDDCLGCLRQHVTALQEALRLMEHWDDCWAGDDGRRLPEYYEDEEPPECFCPKQRAPGTYFDNHMAAP